MINAEILITYAAQYRRNYQDIENETKNAELEFKMLDLIMRLPL